jgi:hypothetical protein
LLFVCLFVVRLFVGSCLLLIMTTSTWVQLTQHLLAGLNTM